MQFLISVVIGCDDREETLRETPQNLICQKEEGQRNKDYILRGR